MTPTLDFATIAVNNYGTQGANLTPTLDFNQALNLAQTQPFQVTDGVSFDFSNGNTTESFFSMDNLFGNQNQVGVLPTVLGGLDALSGAIMGFQNYNLAKDQLAFQKQAYEANMANQVKMTNAQLRDRQAARHAANPQAYESADSYMAKNEVGK